MANIISEKKIYVITIAYKASLDPFKHTYHIVYYYVYLI